MPRNPTAAAAHHAGASGPTAAAARLLAVRAAQSSFEGFVRAMHPEFELQPFHLEMIATLDALERRELRTKRGTVASGVMINMPPRRGKSQIGNKLFTAYFMGRNPARHVINAAYGIPLAKGVGRAVREYANNPLTLQAFPDFTVSANAAAALDWQTDIGGSYWSTGIMGAASGKPANLLIIDDPVKNRAEAESPTYRAKVTDQYESVFTARLEPEIDGTQPVQVVILTRWHPDDLGGYIQSLPEWEGDWVHLNFPALVPDEDAPPDPITNEPPLKSTWPSHFPTKELLKRRDRAPRDFEALYQQSPYLKGGNLIKEAWFNRIPTADMPDNFYSVIGAIDTAFTKSRRSDYTVILVGGLGRDGNYYILDVIRAKLDLPELKRLLTNANARWRPKGLRSFHVEEAGSGTMLLQEMRSNSGIALIPRKVSRVQDRKEQDIHAVTPLLEGGLVYLPDDAPWVDDFLTECSTFPDGAHDDQVDALSILLDVLSKTYMAIDPEGAGVAGSSGLFANHDTIAARAASGEYFSTVAATNNSLLAEYQRLTPHRRPTFRNWGE